MNYYNNKTTWKVWKILSLENNFSQMVLKNTHFLSTWLLLPRFYFTLFYFLEWCNIGLKILFYSRILLYSNIISYIILSQENQCLDILNLTILF